jgi:hypothetical protein
MQSVELEDRWGALKQQGTRPVRLTYKVYRANYKSLMLSDLANPFSRPVQFVQIHGIRA